MLSLTMRESLLLAQIWLRDCPWKMRGKQSHPDVGFLLLNKKCQFGIQKEVRDIPYVHRKHYKSVFLKCICVFQDIHCRHKDTFLACHTFLPQSQSSLSCIFYRRSNVFSWVRSRKHIGSCRNSPCGGGRHCMNDHTHPSF